MSAVPPSSASSVKGTTPIGIKPEHSLLTWKDPQKTAKVFGISIATLLSLKYVNLINLFFRFAFITLFASAAAEYVGKVVTGTGFASRFRPAQANRLSKLASEYSPKFQSCAANFEKDVVGITFSADIEKTLKIAALSFVLYKITSWFSLYTILLSSLILTFTVPAVYVTYQKEIHQISEKYLSLAKSKAAEYKDIAIKESKPYISQVNAKLAPVTDKIGAYFPKNRTAGTTVGASPVPQHTEPVPVATSSGSNIHTTTALPKAPTSEPLSAQHIDVGELKQAIKQNKESAGL